MSTQRASGAERCRKYSLLEDLYDWLDTCFCNMVMCRFLYRCYGAWLGLLNREYIQQQINGAMHPCRLTRRQDLNRICCSSDGV